MEQYGDVSLVPNDYKNYRCFCAEYSRRFKRERKRDPFHGDYTKKLSEFERAIRLLLASYFYTDDQRVLRYFRKIDSYAGRVEYREIDFVISGKNEPEAFIELKFRERYKAQTNTGQLRKSLRIGRDNWENLKGFWLNIHMGPIFGTEACPESQYMEMQGLVSFVHEQKILEAVTPIWLSGENIINEAVRRGFLEPQFTKKLISSRKDALDPISIVPKSKTRGLCLGDMFPLTAFGLNSVSTGISS